MARNDHAIVSSHIEKKGDKPQKRTKPIDREHIQSFFKCQACFAKNIFQ